MPVPDDLPLSQIPALKPPPGVVPNFVDPPTIGSAVIAVNAAFLALMVIFVSIRIYTKGKLLRSLGWEDYASLVAAAGCVCHTGIVIQQTEHGFGRHMWDVPVSFMTAENIRVLLSEVFVVYVTSFFIKFSILLLYLRIFTVKKALRLLICGGIVVQAIGYTAFAGQAIALIVECSKKTAATSSLCLNTWAVSYTQAIFSVVTDFYTLVLPIRVVAKLQMSKRRKLGVLTVFMTGLLACSASLVRAILTIQHVRSLDATYEAAYVSIYVVVELNTGLIAGALNVVPVFCQKLGLGSFCRSAIGSVRSRLSGRAGSPDRSGDPAKPGSGLSAAKARAFANGRYIELDKLPTTTATVWAKSSSNAIAAIPKDNMSEGSILRTDEYCFVYSSQDGRSIDQV